MLFIAPIEDNEHEEERCIIQNINENIFDHILNRLKEETFKDSIRYREDGKKTTK